jgi:hypothetical protein
MGWGFLGGISATIVALLAVVILNGPLHLGYDLDKVGTLFGALAVKMGWLCAAIAGVRHVYFARSACTNNYSASPVFRRDATALPPSAVCDCCARGKVVGSLRIARAASSLRRYRT